VRLTPILRSVKLKDYITSHIAVIKAYGKAIPKAWRRIARIFVALGDPHRQRIVLMFEPGERLNIGQIVAASTLSRTAVAHHLRVLREAGVLRSEKTGREVFFWPDADAVREALDAVKEYVRRHQ
jgi:ArsR family transcriptional regulator, arsenate/arsenite/antimonite-responsive transcriptional repressor